MLRIMYRKVGCIFAAVSRLHRQSELQHRLSGAGGRNIKLKLTYLL
jgi:hypothetical protein